MIEDEIRLLDGLGITFNLASVQELKYYSDKYPEVSFNEMGNVSVKFSCDKFGSALRLVNSRLWLECCP